MVSVFKEGWLARLLNVREDYDEIIRVHRTLYQTLNVFDPSLWMVARLKEEITSDNPLGDASGYGSLYSRS